MTVGMGDDSSVDWRAGIRRAKRSFLFSAVPEACISEFRDCVDHHPWKVRPNAYRKVRFSQPAHRQARRYPSLREWTVNAEQFVVESDS